MNDAMTEQQHASKKMHSPTRDDELLSKPLPAQVLKLLFDRLGISVQTGALTQACEQAQTALQETSPSPAQRFSFIAHALKLQGVQAAQLRWTRLDKRRLPALIFYQSQWQYIEKTKDETFTLTNDRGVSICCTAEALENGIVLWLRTPKKKEESSAFSLKGNIAARLVLSEMFKTRRWLVDIIIATVVINFLAIATSIFAMQVYDRVVPTLAYSTLTTLVTGMFIVLSLDWLLKTIRARTLDSVSCAVDKAVSQQVFDHVMRLQLDTRPRSLGTLAAQVGGLDSVRQFFSSGIVFALVDMPFALFFIAFITLIGGPIGWVYMLLLPIAATLGWVTQRRLRRLLKQQMIRSNERQGLLVDVIQGAESIRSNNASWRFSELWQEITLTISRYNIRQKAISNIATVTTGSLSTVAYVCAIVVGVGQIESGNLTMGALIACSILGGRVIGPVSQSIQYLTQWQNVSQALDMVNQVLVLDSERKAGQNLLLPEKSPESIELSELTFSYPETPVRQLNIANLHFKAGERIAVLGAIGSGKSTLLKVLAGLYRPSEGRVRLGNADLWEIDPNVVANDVSYLPQNVHLFKGSLRSNLVLSGEVSDSHLLDVSTELGIDRIAQDSPMGMDLAISEGGEGLSGGQRQLVGLGRIFLAQPKIWLLDEPTASLDGESEKQVLQALQKHVKPDDILIISTHRPALAKQLASRVIVMDRGEIKADGKPETVLPTMMARKSAGNGLAQRKLPNHASSKEQGNNVSFNPANMNKGSINVI